ncbi:MAG: histidine phosphatase family protein [Anaerolineae bacterium]|nr:histidine phosphatase family protein [Anaerolineae bacterium]
MHAYTTFYLIRHARSEANAAERVQGWLDSPLDAYGNEQARLLGERFKRKSFHAIIASPSLRASETAQAIAVHHGLVVRKDDRLLEYNLGAITGMTVPEIQAFYGVERHGHTPPGGESVKEIRDRVQAFMQDTFSARIGQTVLIVSHGGTISQMIAYAIGLPAARPQPFSLGNTSVTRLEYSHGHWKLRSLNDRHHLLKMDDID